MRKYKKCCVHSLILGVLVAIRWGFEVTSFEVMVEASEGSNKLFEKFNFTLKNSNLTSKNSNLTSKNSSLTSKKSNLTSKKFPIPT
jgi:hypothetical protein